MIAALLAVSLLAPVQLSPSNRAIQYVGRFDIRDTAGPRCSWSASTVELGIHGTGLSVKLADVGQGDFWQVLVDGKPTSVLELKQGANDYVVAKDLPNEDHQIQLVKRTEAFGGITQILGVTLDEGTHPLLRKEMKRRIEVIGDSISCGFGNEGKTKEEPFRLATENASETYGAIAARKFGAQFVDIAWSGRKMWPDNTIPSIYDLSLPTDTASTFDFKTPEPDAIVIHLATNDFGRDNPEEKGWVQAYSNFIAHLRSHYPKALVYCAMGSMMSDGYPAGHNALSTLHRYLTEIVDLRKSQGDKNVKIIEFAQQLESDGIGSSWHPNLVTHRKMAAVLADALHRDLNW